MLTNQFLFAEPAANPAKDGPCDPDLTPPAISCVDIAVVLDPVTGLANIFAAEALYGTHALSYLLDECDGSDPADFDITSVPAVFSCADVGVVATTIYVEDSSNNVADCVVNVTVVDNTPPTITSCPAPRTVTREADCYALTPDLTGEVVAFDLCGIATITQHPPAGAPIAGDTTVTLYVEDPSGNIDSCTTLLTVECGAVPPFAAGAGTAGSPYEITNLCELQAVGCYITSHFVLMNDIDASETVNWGNGAGFKPIAGNSPRFTGSFNGRDKRIFDLYINRPSLSYVGLFGGVGTGGIVQRLGLRDIFVAGNTNAGGLTGVSAGNLSLISVMGAVTGQAQTVGGLVGFVGGGTVSECYSLASVSGTDNVGGLAGLGLGAVSNCYAAGAVNGTTANVGGVLGNTWGPVTRCYWDVNTTGQALSTGSDAALFGKTTSQMRRQATFVDWNFTSTWAIVEDMTYPFFQAFVEILPVIYVADPPEGGSITGPDTILKADSGQPDETKEFTVSITPTYRLDSVTTSSGVVTHVSGDTYRLSGVTADPTVTATFIKTWTLNYALSPGGSLLGDAVQIIDDQGNGTEVLAVPDESAGYYFVSWSDGIADNPRIDETVSDDLDVTALFDLYQYTLDYFAEANGAILGDAHQVVYWGTSGTPVTADPDEGHYFVTWSDAILDNPRTDEDVTGPISVSASFALYQYTLAYLAGDNGVVIGESPQIVDHFGSSEPVFAEADEGYHFVSWSDSLTDNPRQDTNISTAITVTALFAINEYQLTYGVDGNGAIVGTNPQTVEHGSDGEAVLAVPEPGYRFTQWNDGNMANPRQDLGIDGDITVSAMFIDDLIVTVVNNETSVDKIIGEYHTLAVSVAGASGIVNYEWFRDTETKDFMPIPGAIGDELVLGPLELNDSGKYFCLVSDDWDVAASPVITLRVDLGIPAASLAGLALLGALSALTGCLALRRK